jgi:hypothetical protein
MTEPLHALAPLIGQWSVRASFPASAPASLARGALPGLASFAWTLGGRFVLQRVEIAHPDVPDSTAMIAYDAAAGAFTQHYFDSRGVARVYAMSFADGVWTLLRERPDFTALDFAQRFIGELSADGQTIVGRWQTADGDRWKHDFELTYTRIG